MARVLTIGDPHFKQRGIYRYIKMSEEIVARAKELKPDAVVVLGDTLHTHESTHQTPYDMACKMIMKLSEICPTIVLIGNHDYQSNQEYLSDKHFFNPLKQWNNVTIVDTAVEIQIGKYIFGACPYVYPGLFKKALFTHFTTDSLLKCRAVFGHQEMKDVQLGPIKSEIGDVWEDEMPLLITGHIHEFCILKTNIIYTGTPIQHNFGDGTDKGIYLFEFEDNNYQMKKIKLDVPMKRIFRVTLSELRELEIPDNTEAKIIVTVTPEQYSMAEKEGLIQYFRDNGATVIHEDTTLKQFAPEMCGSKPFLDILYDKIKHDKCLTDVYTNIFSCSVKPDVKPDVKPARKIVIKRK